MRSTRWCWHRVAVALEKAVFTRAKPGDGPFKFLPVKLYRVGKGGGNHQGFVSGRIGKIIGKAARIMQAGLGRNGIIIAKQCRIAPPTNFNTGK